VSDQRANSTQSRSKQNLPKREQAGVLHLYCPETLTQSAMTGKMNRSKLRPFLVRIAKA
jgi:hypothetical protein